MNVPSNSNPVTENNPGFHFAPENWQESDAERIARIDADIHSHLELAHVFQTASARVRPAASVRRR